MCYPRGFSLFYSREGQEGKEEPTTRREEARVGEWGEVREERIHGKPVSPVPV